MYEDHNKDILLYHPHNHKKTHTRKEEYNLLYKYQTEYIKNLSNKNNRDRFIKLFKGG